MTKKVTDFAVGDRVRAICDRVSGNAVLKENDEGTVVAVEKTYVSVEWDAGSLGMRGFHDCNGNCKKGYGWNVMPSEIDHVNAYESPEITLDAGEVEWLLGGVV